MEFRTEFGACRCCLAEGDHVDLYKEYNLNGQQEIFAHIFQECFNITLPSNPGLSSHICTVCIKKLHEAQSFRSQVLNTQKFLLKELNDSKSSEFQTDALDPLDYDAPMKCEVKLELNSEDDHIDDISDTYSMTSEDDQPIAQIKKLYKKEKQIVKKHRKENRKQHRKKVTADLIPGEKELLKRFQSTKRCSKELKPLPTRASLMETCPIFYGYLERFKGKVIKARMITLNDEIPENLTPRQAKVAKYRKPCETINDVHITDKMAAALNATNLLENSNAIVFKTKIRTGFPCFYCRHVFTNPMDLRSHQKKHPKKLLFKLLMKYPADELIVYAEITDLKCTICEEKYYSLEFLKEHLVSAHGKKMYDIQNRVIPFVLGDKETNFECHVCGHLLETFRTYEQHIQNAHYRNFVCEICNVGFVTKHRLKYHNYMLHDERQIKTCEICKKVFLHKHKYKTHFDSVHRKLLKVKCPKCPERFSHFYARQRHMEAVHGVELLLYKCTECDKTFNRKAGLNMHFKRVHSGNRDVQCELCSFMCFTNTELKQHHHHHHPQSSLSHDWT